MATVRGTYRGLFRATQIAFKNDVKTLNAARDQIRRAYREDKQSALPKEKLDEKIQHAKDIASILRSNIVQGEKDESAQSDRYILNFHKDTELGDNETIKQKSGKRNTLTGEKGTAPVKKCK